MMPMETIDHIKGTYLHLRLALGVLAFFFPIFLLAVGWFIYGVPAQHSMSHYYFGIPKDTELRAFPMRVFFVGILWTIGWFLICYKGFSPAEDRYLNFAGVCALLVSMFPTKVDTDFCPKYCGNPTWEVYVHFASAFLLFACISFVAWKGSETALTELPPDDQHSIENGIADLPSRCSPLPSSLHWHRTT